MRIKALVVFVYISLLLGTFVPLPGLASECGGQSKCIFVLGNSITRHGPSPEIGWVGNWGMAATSPENDYVAQLERLLIDSSNGIVWSADRQDSGFLEKNPDKFRLAPSSIQLSRKADIVIVAVGDNLSSDTASIESFSKAYVETLNAIRPKKGVLACIGTWWTSPKKNKIIQDGCRTVGGVFVDISGLSDSPENVAGNQQKITHKGVAAHPGDIGMKAIANRVFSAVHKRESVVR